MANDQMPSRNPVTPPGGSTPVSPPQTTPAVGLKKSRTSLFFTFIGVFIFLFVLFLVFLVVMLLQGGGDNPILQALGVEPALLQQLLQTLVSLVFGFLSLIAFILFLVGLFRRLTSAKIEQEKKKRSLILALVSGLFFLFFVFIWIVLYFYISQLQLSGGPQAVVLTDPATTINLSAPIDITFSARDIEQVYIRSGIVSYSWDLDGDGVFDDGNGRDIQYRYTSRGNAAGVYNVAVKLILSDGKEVVIPSLVTIANVRSTVHVEYSPQLLEAPVTVSFDASKSVDPDGSIIAYEWDFDADGQVDQTGSKVSWSFEEVGTREIILTVTDNNGEKVEERLSLDFLRGRTKEAVIIARPGLKGQAPFMVSFDGSNSYLGERIQSYEWDFGDNSALASGRTIQHQYSNPGEYTVHLTTVGISGTKLEGTEIVYVERQTNTPQAVIRLKNQNLTGNVVTGSAPFMLQFDAGQSKDIDGTIVEYRWDFDGDGVDDSLVAEASHTYVVEGTFEAKLTVVDDDDLSSTAQLTVQVGTSEVVVEVDVSSYSGSIPLEVTFDASASQAGDSKIISYTWNFGDGTPELIGSARQTHVYSQVGESKVTVSVLTEDGKRASKEFLIVAREVELQADFTFNPVSPQVGQKVFFDASLSQGQIGRYYWEFGDGQISRVVKPDHVFEQAGTHTVTLEVYDRSGQVSRKQAEIIVEGG
ncbi:MAG: PKD domain-containing protein [bacterium]|nr:PKD domain-containing protein [bacterium]